MPWRKESRISSGPPFGGDRIAFTSRIRGTKAPIFLGAESRGPPDRWSPAPGPWSSQVATATDVRALPLTSIPTKYRRDQGSGGSGNSKVVR